MKLYENEARNTHCLSKTVMLNGVKHLAIG